MRRRILGALLLAGALALAGCSDSSTDTAAWPDLEGATEQNSALLRHPVCEVIATEDLERLGLAADDGTEEANPFWAGCRWGPITHPRLHIMATTVTSLDAPIFEKPGVQPIEDLGDERVARAGTRNHEPSDGCATLMVELTADAGAFDIQICGSNAEALAQTIGRDIARDLLHAWR